MHICCRKILVALTLSALPFFHLFFIRHLTAVTIPNVIADGGGTGSTGTPYSASKSFSILNMQGAGTNYFARLDGGGKTYVQSMLLVR